MIISEDFNPVLKAVVWYQDFDGNRTNSYLEIFDVNGKRIDILIDGRRNLGMSAIAIEDAIRTNMKTHEPFRKLIQQMVFAKYVERYGVRHLFNA